MMPLAVSKNSIDIAVVGGGIAGLALTIGLLKQNVKVTLYESASRFGEIGAGIAFGPNSTRAMTMIDDAVRDGLHRCATYNQWDSKRDVWFDFRYGKDLENQGKTGDLIHTLYCPLGQATAHRAQFLDEMIKLVPESVTRLGKRLVDLDDLGEDRVRLKFRDGTTAIHSAVVGCDGIKSETRKYILGRDNPSAFAKFTGKYCHRGLVPMEKAAATLGSELASNNNLYLGHQGHIITFPVAHGKFMNVVAISSQETWESQDWVVPTTREAMHEDYKGWGERIHEIINLVDKADVWALFDHSHGPATKYFKGRICMIGDAAHAATPHQGSGAGMAIEDAMVLGKLLGQVQHPIDIEAAFKAFDSVRRERTLKLVETTREASHLLGLDLEGVGDDMAKVRENIEYRMRWIWDEDLQAEVDDGLMYMAAVSKL